MSYTLVQVRAFSVAVERQERERLTLQFAMLVTAGRGTAEEVKRLMGELAL